MRARVAVFTAMGACLLPVMAACSSSPSSSPRTNQVDVTASDTACQVATTSFESGDQTFAISNAGSQVTEVIFYGAGDRVVGEVSNIGPSSGKNLTVALKPGRYEVSCKPGLVGEGIRTPITVKAPHGDDGPSTSPALDAAVAAYRTYVVAQAESLLAKTKPFVAAVVAGNVTKARSLYPAARVPYENIEPIAELSGDLDSRIDARIDDVETGKEWIGFHRLEHDLWLPVVVPDDKSDAGDAPIGSAGYTSDISKDGPVATALLTDVGRLVDQVQRVELSADQICSAAQSLLEKDAQRGLAGQQERYSGVDLVDVAANVAGARQAYQAVRSILLTTNPNLAAKVDLRFAAAQEALDEYGSGSSFAVYDALSKDDLHTLAAAVNALIGPMNDVTAILQKSG